LLRGVVTLKDRNFFSRNIDQVIVEGEENHEGEEEAGRGQKVPDVVVVVEVEELAFLKETSLRSFDGFVLLYLIEMNAHSEITIVICFCLYVGELENFFSSLKLKSLH